MVQRSNDAALKDALIKPSKEEYVSSMGQRSIIDAIVKGAQIKSSKEECA